MWTDGRTAGCSEVDRAFCEADSFVTDYHTGKHCDELGFDQKCDSDGETHWCTDGKPGLFTVSYSGEWSPGGGLDPYAPNNHWAEVAVATTVASAIPMRVSLSSTDIDSVGLYLVDFDDGEILAADEDGADNHASVDFSAGAGKRFYIVSSTGVENVFGHLDVTAELTMEYEEEEPFLVIPEFGAGMFDPCLLEHKGCLSGGPLDACFPNPCRAMSDPYPFKGWYSLEWGPATCSQEPDIVYEGTGTMHILNDQVTITGFSASSPNGKVGSDGVLVFPPTPDSGGQRVEGTIVEVDGVFYVEGTAPARCSENDVIYEVVPVPFEGTKDAD